MSDTHANKFHGGISLKDRAKQWLESAGESKLIAEKEALQARLNDMEAQMAQMQEHMARQPDTRLIDADPARDDVESLASQAAPDKPRRATRNRKKPAEK
jgi:hypothetical protein